MRAEEVWESHSEEPPSPTIKNWPDDEVFPSRALWGMACPVGSAIPGIQGKSGEKSKDSDSCPCLQPKEKERVRREMRQRYQASVLLKFCYGPKWSH